MVGKPDSLGFTRKPPPSTFNYGWDTAAADRVGSDGVIELTNGNYVVVSPFVTIGGQASAGAVTWGSGAAGVTGTVSVTNETGTAYSTALFTVMLIVICLHRARALVVIRAVQIALAERNDTVSLLLREFEETAADWLWETDAGKQIVKASPRFAYACGLDPIAINGQSFLRVLAGPAWDTGHFSDALRELAAKMKARESFRDLRIAHALAVGEDNRRALAVG